ncbi:MAG: sigma-54 dependent transcriptional regulator [Paracoccaceae bacterium]
MGNILVVDDEADIRELIADILRDEGHEVRLGWDGDSAFAEINAKAPDLIILDIWLKDSKMDGIDILKQTKRDNPAIPVIIISGHGNVEIAVAAVKQGAYDFIEKPFNIDQLLVVIARGLEVSRLRRENETLRRGDMAPTEMIGESAALRTLKAQLEKVTRSNSRVMLTGPSGAGKEVAARFIHAHSERENAPFITVNSASIAPDRMEEVLFGLESEARGHQPGLFERAHGGVLFFDEVADMPAGTQSKILRVLVEQSFQRVGGSDTVRVDVRVISASSRNLQEAIANGAFREDLFHRLNVVPIDVPSLEARRDDILLLCAHFMQLLNAEQGLPVREFSPEAQTQLQAMPWPGNIRQLRNTIERILILGPESGPISVRELPKDSGEADENNSGLRLGLAMTLIPLREAREAFEREYLIMQINRFNGNISRTSSFVGMERSALHRKMRSLNIISVSHGAEVINEQD